MKCPRSQTGYATDKECCARICATEHSADLATCLACERGQRLAATSPIQSRPVPVATAPVASVPPEPKRQEVATLPSKLRIVAQVISHVLEQYPFSERHGVDYLYTVATGEFCLRRVSRIAFEARCAQAGLTLETRKRKAFVLVDNACRRLVRMYRETGGGVPCQ